MQVSKIVEHFETKGDENAPYHRDGKYISLEINLAQDECLDGIENIYFSGSKIHIRGKLADMKKQTHGIDGVDQAQAYVADH